MTNNHLLTRLSMAVAGLFMVSNVQASLFDRGNGLIYDDVLDVTWLSNANYAQTEFAANPNRINEIIDAVGSVAGHTLSAYDFVALSGRMSWWGAVAWADQLVFGGYSDWRLPTADASCAYNYHCTGNEMGQLYYDELGGTAGFGASGTFVGSSGDADLSKFTNIQSWVYWETGAVDPGSPADAARGWDFHLGNYYRGYQFSFPKTNTNFNAWAVRDGDISAVPVPAAAWLFGTGLVSMAAWGRRKQL